MERVIDTVLIYLLSAISIIDANKKISFDVLNYRYLYLHVETDLWIDLIEYSELT